MIQEYLFIGTENICDESDLCIEGIVPEIEVIENSDCKIVKYMVTGGDEDSAKLLSVINEIVVDKYEPTVLTNESSAYFNRRLFPFFNEFERKLRKLIYLKSALYKDKDEAKVLDDLEEMTFNEIFTILFTDERFMSSLREKTRDKNYKFSSYTILKYINELPESTLWSKMFEKGAVNKLDENFEIIRHHRNDIMHAHNISFKSYKNALNLIKKTNAELDLEIGRTIGLKESKIPSDEPINYNKIINETIVSNRFNEGLSALQEALGEYNHSAIEEIASSPEFFELFEMQKKLNEISLISRISAIQEILNSPTMIELREKQDRIRENLGATLGKLPKVNSTSENDLTSSNQTKDTQKENKSSEDSVDDKNKKNKPSSD